MRQGVQGWINSKRSRGVEYKDGFKVIFVEYKKGLKAREVDE